MSATSPTTVTIECPSCGTQYALPNDAVGPAGRKVSCAKCGTSWHAERPAEADLATDDASRSPAGQPGVTALSDTEENRLDDRFKDLDIKLKAPRKRQLGGIDLNAIGIDEGMSGGTGQRAGRYRRSRTDAELRGPGERILARLRLLSLLSTVALAAGLVVFRTDVVRAAPDLAALYDAVGLPVNVIGLDITDLRTLVAKRGSTDVMTVEMALANATSGTVSIPEVIITLLNDDHEILYAWSVMPMVPTVAAGERASVSAELSNPPIATRRVLVSFAGGPVPDVALVPRTKPKAPSFTVEQPTPLDIDSPEAASPAESDTAPSHTTH
jgi:predicted Zn finger-like uncharacterized protein